MNVGCTIVPAHGQTDWCVSIWFDLVLNGMQPRGSPGQNEIGTCRLRSVTGLVAALQIVVGKAHLEYDVMTVFRKGNGTENGRAAHAAP